MPSIRHALPLFATASLMAAAAIGLTPTQPPAGIPLPTGKWITPIGNHVSAGSFPTTLALSPNGKFVVASSLGSRCQLTVFDTQDGRELSKLVINGKSPAPGGRNAGLYVGLAFSPSGTEIYASRGSDHRVGVYSIDDNGKVADTGFTIDAEYAAGVAVDSEHVFVAANHADPKNQMRGWISIAKTGTPASKRVSLPGYPLAVCVVGGKAYVSSEQDSALFYVDPLGSFPPYRIPVGSNPSHITPNRDKSRLFVSNSGSDTLSVVDTASNKVVDSILLRPGGARALPSATPLGSALHPDGKTLFVALADLNAVAVVDTAKGDVRGYIPTGWYPTAVAVTPDGKSLFVANAQGNASRLPNGNNRSYIQTLFEGTVARIDVAGSLEKLAESTKQVLANNQADGDILRRARTALRNPGIDHVIYVIKENRTYDQVLGDLPQGNGDPTLTLFPREITPNQHALAERFVLLDNFYCAAEVSGDGWNVSTAGSANAYVKRNVAYGYSGKARPYDYEGTNNGVAPDRAGIVDVARSPGGYVWDRALAKGLSVRNYGMFTDDVQLPRKTAEEGAEGLENRPTKKALDGVTCPDYRQYDLTFADSEAWAIHQIAPAPKQKPAYGAANDPARITTWRREYLEYARTGTMPKLMLVRLGNDHTAGTSPGMRSPRAMVAENDFALGQLVEAVSKGPYWKKTAILVVEDDAQNGYDHVDAHRSIAFVISPFVPKGSHDSRFFNTDSVLHTIANLLGTEPMTLADATAPVLAVFSDKPDNDSPFEAILPAKRLIEETNQANAYKARESARWINPLREESAPDEMLNEILWRSLRGKDSMVPKRRYGVRMTSHDD